jgi:hypothetical protein
VGWCVQWAANVWPGLSGQVINGATLDVPGMTFEEISTGALVAKQITPTGKGQRSGRKARKAKGKKKAAGAKKGKKQAAGAKKGINKPAGAKKKAVPQLKVDRKRKVVSKKGGEAPSSPSSPPATSTPVKPPRNGYVLFCREAMELEAWVRCPKQCLAA